MRVKTRIFKILRQNCFHKCTLLKRKCQIFWTVQKVFGLSEKFMDCPENLKIVWKISWIVRTVSRLSGQFLDCPKSFWIIWTVSRLSGMFLDFLDF